jgi:hypothetical protein
MRTPPSRSALPFLLDHTVTLENQVRQTTGYAPCGNRCFYTCNLSRSSKSWPLATMAASVHAGNSESGRVPAMYLTWANVLFLAFLAFNEISKLRAINRGQNSDSRRLHTASGNHSAVQWGSNPGF